MRLLLVAVASVLAVLALIWLGQRRLMYFPHPDVPAPAAVGLADVEQVTFTADDGVQLHGWFVAAAQAPARATMLVCNGNAGNRAYRAELAQAFRRQGLAVLLFDYRGYGDSAGTPTEHGLALDARAARRYLLSRPDVDATRLVYFGESLGSAVAVELAVEHPPAALVLRSPFSSMADIGGVHYPVLPVRMLLRDRYATIDRIAHVRAPLLVIAGDADRIVPIAQSRRVHDAARSPKSFIVIEGADPQRCRPQCRPRRRHRDDASGGRAALTDSAGAAAARQAGRPPALGGGGYDPGVPSTHETLAEALAAETDVRLAVLFGSEARGEASGDSDLDVALVGPDASALPLLALRLTRAMGREVESGGDAHRAAAAPVPDRA